MRANVLFLVLCSTTFFPTARAETEPVESRVKAAASEMSRGWASLRETFKKPDVTNAERSKAIDSLFSTLGNIVARDGDEIVSGLLEKARRTNAPEPESPATMSAAETAEKVKTWVGGAANNLIGKLDAHPNAPKEAREGLLSLAGTLNELVDNLNETYGPEFDKRRRAEQEKADDGEEAFAKAEEFIGKVRDHRLLPRAELAVHLLRDILRLEEQRVFDLLTKNGSRASKIDAVAAISKDAAFIGKQARALARMVIQIADTATEIAADQADLGEGSLLRAESRRKINASLEKFFPTLLQTADDLGVYYAKVLQSFSGLIFHVNRDVYEKIDYFQGKLPQTMSFEQVKAVIEEDLGLPLDRAFASFEREPRANGSIAQVHFATTFATAKSPSRTVAVKVLKTSAPAELAWNQRTNDVLFKYAEAIAPEEASVIVRFFTAQARQLGREFMGEMDLGRERWRQDLFRKILAPVKSVAIPETLPALSGPRVLTSEAVLDARRIHEPFPDDTWIQTPEERAKAAAKAAAEAAAGNEDPLRLVIERDQDEDSEALDGAREELRNTLNDEGTGNEVSFGALFMEFNEKFGFSVRPRYFQVLRSAIPFVSVNVHLVRTMKRLIDQGRSKDDPEVKALVSMTEGSVSSFLAQLFYAREIHADYNWGNLLVDPQYKTHLIDWGSTVRTDGLILQPLLLVGAFLKGNAELVLKRLDQIGHFENLERDREAILTRIQAVLDEAGLEKHSYPGLLWDMLKTSRETKEARADVKAKFGRAKRRAEKARSTDAAKPADGVSTTDSATADSATAAAKPNARRAEIMSGLARGLWPLAKTLAKYPYHRIRVRLIRARHGPPPPCSPYLTDI